MRLKKSSSGTVGPRTGGGGGAQRWSSRREPYRKRSIFSHFVSKAAHSYSVGYLAFDEHVEEIVVRLGVVGVGHEMTQNRLVAVLIEPEARQASPRCRRVLQTPT